MERDRVASWSKDIIHEKAVYFIGKSSFEDIKEFFISAPEDFDSIRELRHNFNYDFEAYIPKDTSYTDTNSCLDLITHCPWIILEFQFVRLEEKYCK